MTIQQKNSVTVLVYSLLWIMRLAFLFTIDAISGYRSKLSGLKLPDWIFGPVAHFSYMSAGVTLLIYLGALKLQL